MTYLKYISALFSFQLFVAILLLQNSFSQPAWVSRYNNPAGDLQTGNALVVDNAGNLFVTGTNSIVTGNADVITIKLNAATGDTVWVNRFGGSANLNDAPTAIVTDNAGFIYVTGWVFNPTRDMFVIKYDAVTGSAVWVRTYNGPGNGGDYSWDVAVDGSSNVYITGRSDQNVVSQRMTTIKYNSSGTVQWIAVYIPGMPVTGLLDEARSLKVDGSGNVYITGTSRFNPSAGSEDYLTIKYNSSGVLQWFKRYNGNMNADDYAIALVIDNVPDVYVTGYSNRVGANFDYVTIKYNGMTGDSMAAGIYNGSGSGVDVVTDMKIDNANNIYITGWSQGILTGADYATVKYNSNLSQQWSARWNRTGIMQFPAALAVNNLGEVYVTGSTPNGVSGYDYLTIKYGVSGNQVVVQTYNGSANGNDYAKAIGLDASSNVYITGAAVFGSPADTDFVTLKYGADLTAIHPVTNEIPSEYSLSQNYPNPFNPVTTFNFGIPKESYVRVTVYDILGKEVAVLVNDVVKPGKYEVTWNADGFSSGIYLYRLNAGDYSQVKKMILNK